MCAALNFAAAFALLLVLAPATPLVADPMQRLTYVGTHLLEWRLGWLTWIAAALSLLWFYWWWRDRVGASYLPLVFGGLGLVADVAAELILIVGGVETYVTTSPFAFALTGGVANGLYTICGIGLFASRRVVEAQGGDIWYEENAGGGGVFAFSVPLATEARV